MLVLTRKVLETITVDGLKITVLDVSKGRVKLGFAGDRKIVVRRGELDKPEAPLRKHLMRRLS